MAGAKNVVQDDKQQGLLQVTPDRVQGWNPAIILAGSPTFANQLQNDERWATVDAVRNGRVYRVPAGPFGWIESPPSVNRLFGLTWLRRLLRPDVFQVDVASETRLFYRLFYQVDLTQAQLDGILQGAGVPTTSGD